MKEVYKYLNWSVLIHTFLRKTFYKFDEVENKLTMKQHSLHDVTVDDDSSLYLLP